MFTKKFLRLNNAIKSMRESWWERSCLNFVAKSSTAIEVHARYKRSLLSKCNLRALQKLADVRTLYVWRKKKTH